MHSMPYLFSKTSFFTFHSAVSVYFAAKMLVATGLAEMK